MSKSNALSLKQDASYERLKDFVIQATGLIYFQDKDQDFCNRLERRLDAVQVRDCATYLAMIMQSPGANLEFNQLVTELTIGETYFFRHIEQFNALQNNILPELIERNQHSRRLRIWCAGCSIGAEPYSIAILIKEHFSIQLEGWDVTILATDINRDYLARAEKGRFDDWAFRTTDPEFRRRHFDADGKAWVIKPHLRDAVRFSHHNLMEPATLNVGVGAIDLIICRNVLIYFDQARIEKLIPNFESALGEGGWLILGHAELAYGASHLRMVQLADVMVYKKTDLTVDPFLYPVAFTAPQLPMPQLVLAPLVSSKAPARKNLAVTADAISYVRRLADRGQLDLALAQCVELLQLHQANAVVYYYQALVLQQMGRPTEVKKSLNQAIGLEPNFVMAHYYLALVYRQEGNSMRATQSFKAASSLLGSMPGHEVLPEADGITALELKNVISVHLGAA